MLVSKEKELKEALNTVMKKTIGTDTLLLDAVWQWAIKEIEESYREGRDEEIERHNKFGIKNEKEV